ncbi:MAG TPA: hypothetical protein VKQ36_03090, partial [Ktedonobacterales bacterium]|nr:hypothetical protein [Ktedonobacterales bacterium]
MSLDHPLPTDFDPTTALLPPVAQPPTRVLVAGKELAASDGKALVSEAATSAPRLPGSKYYTLRYTLAAALAIGESLVSGPAISDDTAVLVRALRALGAKI